MWTKEPNTTGWYWRYKNEKRGELRAIELDITYIVVDKHGNVFVNTGDGIVNLDDFTASDYWNCAWFYIECPDLPKE